MISLGKLKKIFNRYNPLPRLKRSGRIIDFFLGIIVAPIFYFVLSLIIFFLLTGQLKSRYLNEEMEQFILGNFPSEYSVEITEDKLNNFGEPTIIVFAHDKRYYAFCEIDKPSADLLPPILRIYEKRNDIIVQLLPYIPPYSLVYEAKIEPQNADAFFRNLFIYEKDVSDLDNDGKKEIVLRVLTPPCGSGADVYNLIFAKISGRYQLVASLPDIAYFKDVIQSGDEATLVKSKVEAKEKPEDFFQPQSRILKLNKQEVQEVVYASTDYLLDFKDIDDDGVKELVAAKMLWEFDEGCFEKKFEDPNCECHFCPHHWLVGVYKYEGGDFVSDNKFNSGLLFHTEKKLTLFEVQGYKPIPYNIFGSIGLYYGIGHFGQGKTGLDFNYKTRNKSVIYELISEHYIN